MKKMKKDDSTKLFDIQSSMDDVVKKCFEKKCYDLKQSGKKSIELKFEGNTFVIQKKKDGYYASNSFPGYIFFIIWGLVSLIVFFVKFKGVFGYPADVISSSIGAAIGLALIPSYILYLIIALIYDSKKKKALEMFCKKIKSE